MFGATPQEKAYTAPFLVFIAMIAMGELIRHLFEGQAVFWMLGEPQYWINPLQAILCGALMFRWRPLYRLSAPRRTVWTLCLALIVFLVWIAPQAWLGFPGRWSGFDPYRFGRGGPAFLATVSLRLLRMVVAVPLLEEIFWRGFLLRYLIKPNFTEVPFGTFTWSSFLIVTAGFCLEHSRPDWPAAIVAGAVYNIVAYRSKSLSDCVLAHAATNLLLGIYVLWTGQWGFW